MIQPILQCKFYDWLYYLWHNWHLKEGLIGITRQFDVENTGCFEVIGFIIASHLPNQILREEVYICTV